MAGVSSPTPTVFQEGPLDVLFDADEGELMIINHHNSMAHKLSGIPRDQPLTPHFGLHTSPQQITVAPISLRSFGVTEKTP
jgi:hypothetical protein